MSPELDEINRTIRALLVESVPNGEIGGISYLLHHIRDDVFVPIAISQKNGLGDSEYYLAFSRLSSEDLNTHEVSRLDATIPVLLKRGRVESLCFRECQNTSFWQELIPLSTNNRLVLVRASCNVFDPLPLGTRRFALPCSNYTHSQWEKAGNAFLALQNLGATVTSCNEIVSHLARHLADEEELPPFFDLVNFHIEVKAAHDLTPCRRTRCNPLGFTTGVAVDFAPTTWLWIPDMASKCADGKHLYVQHIPSDYSNILQGIENALYKSIVDETHDLVVRVSACEVNKSKWQFFARHNRKRNEEDPALLTTFPPTTNVPSPFAAIAFILEHKTIQGDHLVTLWAVNPDMPEQSLAVGSRVDKIRFPDLAAAFKREEIKENTISAILSSRDEYVRITFQPRTGCSEKELNSLRINLQDICDAILQRVRLLAPMEHLKSLYANILNSTSIWLEPFKTNHKAAEFKSKATDLEWAALGNSVITALSAFSTELNLWPCLKSYDPGFKLLYLHAAKSFAQRFLCPEMCVMLAGGLTVMFPANGYLLLITDRGWRSRNKGMQLAAGLILLGKEDFILTDAEFSLSSISGQRTYPLLKFRFESQWTNVDGSSSKAGTYSKTSVERKCPDSFEIGEIRTFSSTCFHELSPEIFGRKHKLRTALQLVRKHASVFSAGLSIKRSKLTPTIYMEFKCVDKP